MFEDSLKKALSGFGMEINEEQAKKMRLFYDFLIEKNKVMNLTAITGEDESAGAVIPAVVAGDPERLCRDR